MLRLSAAILIGSAAWALGSIRCAGQDTRAHTPRTTSAKVLDQSPAAVPNLRPAVAPEQVVFVRHLLDTNLFALGADIGDRDDFAMADIIALDQGHVYWYARGRRHLIDDTRKDTLLIHLRTADVDGDHDIDAIAADHRTGVLIYYENPGHIPAKERPWPKHIIDDKIAGAHAVALGDINRDGRIDVVASGEIGAAPPNSLCWLLCPEKPNRSGLWRKFVLGRNQSGGLAHYPALGDVNGDGKLDVVHAAKEGDWYKLWYQPDDPAGPWPVVNVGAHYDWATNIQIGDVNGDKVTDLVATQGHAQGILWFQGPDWEPHYIDQSLRSPHTLALADIDRDNDLDVVTCAFESKALVWFSNEGRGAFTAHPISSSQAAYDLVARDVDGDGDLDLVVAGQESRTVSWYEQKNIAP